METDAATHRGCRNGCACTLEERVIRHCAPTLAGIKCGSMFRMCAPPSEIMAGLRSINRALRSCGVFVMALRSEPDALLVYAYRPELLSETLSGAGVRKFLGDYGYGGADSAGYLRHLRSRFAEIGMPHEVGIFLGYPLADVEGFMRYGGGSCVCSGCWKSYGDPAEAERRFSRCRECTKKCMEMYAGGCPISDLAVCGC